MRNLIIGFTLTIASFNIYAADERQATKIVKKYSETIACATENPENKNQYKAVTIKPGSSELAGYGAIFVVYWEGSVGCPGGNGTVTPNFTVVEQRAGESLIVVTDYKFPDLDFVYLTSFSGKNGELLIKGVSYGAKDEQHNPTKRVSYKVKFVGDAFVKQ